MDEQVKKIFKLIAGAAIFLLIVSAIDLWLFKDFDSVAIGITTGIISGVFVLLFQKGFIENESIPTTPTQPLTSATPPRIKGENQIKLELEVAKVYLTGIGLAFTVESVFIGLFGKSVVNNTMDFGYYQLTAITVMFVILMIVLWCDYQKKLKEVETAFPNTTPPESPT